GESMLESDAVRLLAPYGSLTLLTFLTLLWLEPTRRAALFATLWLAVPVAAILGLASMAPKFNSRYVMIALPGLLLLWAGGLAAILARPPVRGMVVLRLLQRTLALLLALGALIGFAVADRNWFVEPAFTK